MNDAHVKNPAWLPVVALLLFGVACLFVVALMERYMRMERRTPEDVSDPFFKKGAIEENDQCPEIGKVYMARRDREILLSESESMEKRFQENILKRKAVEKDDEAELLLKRDEFAGRRLEILKKIEKAETPEERRKLIELFSR